MSSIAERVQNQCHLAGQRLARLCLGVSGGLLLLLTILTICEVLGRYLLNAPISGKADLAKMLLAMSLFFAFPVVTLRREHIDVDLLDGVFNARFGFIRDRAVDILIGGIVIIAGYWVFDRAAKFLARGSGSEILFIPKYPLTYLIATILVVSGGLLILTALLKIWISITRQCD